MTEARTGAPTVVRSRTALAAALAARPDGGGARAGRAVVMTMGALHAGHLALVREARARLVPAHAEERLALRLGPLGQALCIVQGLDGSEPQRTGVRHLRAGVRARLPRRRQWAFQAPVATHRVRFGGLVHLAHRRIERAQARVAQQARQRMIRRRHGGEEAAAAGDAM